MFLGVFRSAENMKFVLKGRICCTFRVFPRPFNCLRGPSLLVELTGDDDSATSTVAVLRIMSLKEYAWPSHILSMTQSMDQPRVRLLILLVVS